ncbi:hypothetical protein TrVFT333_004886 [Trichoderma virens FT-333]|nr:hypothetical protein TrVFT333_004886 [Trichoderma virens FT-333]
MARPMGSVRLKKANSSTLILGAVLCIFIIIFLVSPSSPASTSRLSIISAQHPLSPPTSPYQSPRSGAVQGPPPVTRYNLNKVTVTADPVKNKEHILILTPMARFYQEYWDNLLRLSYPHELITLGFILPKTKEGNQATSLLQQQIQKTQNHGPEKDRFKSIIILRQDFDPAVASQDEKERHKMGNQKARREVMAKARNSLLFTTLGPSTSWDLASHDKAIIVANCFQKYYDPDTKKMAERPYDFNSWQDSENALKMAEQMGPDDILLEGYAELATYRTLLAYMNTVGGDKGLVQPLDGVGATALLVKADVHRDGAMFPAFSFYHLIESEGFAKMAKRLGWQPYGLPNYKVYHYNE